MSAKITKAKGGWYINGVRIPQGETPNVHEWVKEEKKKKKAEKIKQLTEEMKKLP